MMNLENSFTLTIGLSGIVFLIVAAFMYKFPPKRINPLYGYRTVKAMRNQDTWDFAQKYSSLRMLEVGAVFTILAAISVFVIPKGDESRSLIFLSFMILAGGIIYMFVRTQRASDKNTKD